MASKKIEKLKDSLGELIYLGINNQILNLINDMCQLHLLKPEEELPSFVEETRAKLQDYVSRLPEILSASMKERAAAVKELVELKEKYAADCAPFFACANRLNVSGEYGAAVRERFNPEAMAEAADAGLYSHVSRCVREEIEDYIEDAEDEDDAYMRMSAVLSKIPLRMTKEKYRDLLKKCLEAAIAVSVDEYGAAEGTARLIKLRFFPYAIKEYAALSHPIKDETEALAAQNIDKLSMEQINEYLGKIDKLLDRLQQINSYLGIIYNDINYLMTIFIYCMDIETLTEDDLLLKDAVYTCVNMLKNQDYELYVQALNDSTEEQIDDVLERIFELEPKMMSTINEKLLNSDNELAKNFDVYSDIRARFIKELVDELPGSEPTEPIEDTDKYIEEMAEALTELAVSSPQTVSPARNKYMSSALLAVLPVVMTEEEFFDYVDYAMEGVRGKVTGAIMLYELYKLFTNEDEEDLDFDEDEDGCDCGCHHNHDHDHDHDHEHSHSHSHSHLTVVKNDKDKD